MRNEVNEVKRFVCITLVALLVPSGCGTPRQDGRNDYRTVGRDLRRDTERAQAENRRALDYIGKGNYEQAEKALKAALSADIMHGPAHNNLGKVYFHQRKYYLAAWEFQYASKIMPNQPEPRNNLGLVYEAVGRLDEAVTAYDQAKALEPDNPQFIGNLARSRIRRGERSAEVRQLLQDLVIRETRPNWTAWATEQLAIMPAPTASQPAPATSTTQR